MGWPIRPKSRVGDEGKRREQYFELQQILHEKGELW